MLNSIKEEITSVVDAQPFEEYFQDYVKSVQDNIILHDITSASHNFKDIEDIPAALKGLNQLSLSLTDMNL